MEDIRYKILKPAWRAIKRLFAPDVRIVTGGVAFYALFSIFPMVYLILTLMGLFLPADIAAQLAQPISDILSQGVDPLTAEEIALISGRTPEGITWRAFAAIILVLITASSGAKAAITGIRMIAGSSKRSGVFKFNGASLLLTAVLIFTVWALGAAQLVVAAATQDEMQRSSRLAANIANMADALWISKWIGSFVIFYVIIGLSLRGHVSGGRAKVAGAAIGALTWIGVTFAFQLYLKYSALDTLYGALASVIIGFVWLALSVSCLLLGAALTTEWARVWKDDNVPEI